MKQSYALHKCRRYLPPLVPIKSAPSISNVLGASWPCEINPEFLLLNNYLKISGRLWKAELKQSLCAKTEVCSGAPDLFL